MAEAAAGAPEPAAEYIAGAAQDAVLRWPAPGQDLTRRDRPAAGIGYERAAGSAARMCLAAHARR